MATVNLKKAGFVIDKPPANAIVGELTTYNGNPIVNFRECYRDESGQLNYTKKGFTIPRGMLAKFAQCVSDLERERQAEDSAASSLK